MPNDGLDVRLRTNFRAGGTAKRGPERIRTAGTVHAPADGGLNAGHTLKSAAGLRQERSHLGAGESRSKAIGRRS
jgi:hypothetical protein